MGGDYIHHSNNLITDISRKNKSDLYCSGIQIINPYKINKITNIENNFMKVWHQLIKLKQIKRTKYILKKWYAVDNLLQLKTINI